MRPTLNFRFENEADFFEEDFEFIVATFRRAFETAASFFSEADMTEEREEAEEADL